MDINQAKEAVMKHAASDANFRAFALQNGAGAIGAVGGTLAEGETVTFSETDLPLGSEASSESGELSDEALDQAAGGSGSASIYGNSYYCGGGSPSGRY